MNGGRGSGELDSGALLGNSSRCGAYRLGRTPVIAIPFS